MTEPDGGCGPLPALIRTPGVLVAGTTVFAVVLLRPGLALLAALLATAAAFQIAVAAASVGLATGILGPVALRALPTRGGAEREAA